MSCSRRCSTHTRKKATLSTVMPYDTHVGNAEGNTTLPHHRSFRLEDGAALFQDVARMAEPVG